jgi:hypothetical protein
VGRRFEVVFEMAHGGSPFVDPSLAAALVVDRPPDAGSPRVARRVLPAARLTD